MPSEFIQRRIDRLLEQAAEALDRLDWAAVRGRAEAVLHLDAANSDAQALLTAALAATAASEPADGLPLGEGRGEGQPERHRDPGAPLARAGESPALPGPAAPASFVNGRYQVRKFLGEGGKKKVYLAHDTLLDRDVAFALIKTEGLDDAGRDRITREAQAMGRLGSHPHIVSVFDLGTEPATSSEQRATRHPLSPGVSGAGPPSGGVEEASSTTNRAEGQGEGSVGTPYIVTELMGGGDVEGLIEKAPDHRLPLARTLEIGVEVCRGLEFAHSHGIVHRDLKPGNVWLTEATGNWQPATGAGTPAGSPLPAAAPVAKLGDFGLAVALDRSRLTQAGMMVGTVSYMPPEQAMGGEVTPRSDLYSLGAMLYEMVTGRPPFVGDESVAIITQHLNSAPVSPSWHNPETPPALEALIMRLLEKDPSKRPASAGEVRQALEGTQAAGNRQQATGVDGGTVAGSPLPAAGEDNPMYRRAFVGRETELRQLQNAYDAAVSGRGSLAMVVGEPGIGKTSLCEQLATYATIRGGKTLTGHCYEEGSLSVPYLPFVEAMRSYVLAREPEGLRADLGSGAGEVARIVSEVRDRLQIELPAPGAPEDDRWRLLQATSSFLRNAAAVQPLVIVLEDLHDADRGTLDLLVHLFRNLEGARLLIVGTYRDVEVDRSHPLSSALAELRRGSNFLRVPLRGLTAEEVQRMMAGVSQREIPWPLAELVHRQTEGNPLFVQEMLRYLVEEGLVSKQGGSLRRVGDDSLAGRIPEGLRDVIGKRLSRLSDQTNQVLAIASVIGREFRLDVLQRVGGLDEEALYAALAEAKAVAVVEERSAAGAVVTYRFTHAFFRQTLYEETIAPRRIRLHQQVARALEAVYGRRLEEHAPELAEHYAYSSDPADLAKAVEYGELAAQRALSVYAYGEAERHLEQALKVQEVLDPDDKVKRCDLLLALGEAMLPGEEPARAADAVGEPAFTLAEALRDSDRAWRASNSAVEALFRAGPMRHRSQFLEWIKREDRHAGDGGSHRIRADVHLFIDKVSTTGPVSGHPYLRRAAEAALGTEDDSTFFMAAGFALRNLRAVRDADRVQTVVDEVLQRRRLNARSGDVWPCLFALGFALLERGERAGAETAWEELGALASRTRDIGVQVAEQVTRLALAELDGRLEGALALAQGSEQFAAATRASNTLEHVYPTLQAMLRLGRAEAALARTEAITQRAEWAYNASALAHLGRYAEAREHRERFGDIGSSADETNMGYLALLLEAAVLAADADGARTLAQRLGGIDRFYCSAREGFLCWSRILGGAAALLGEREKARAYYEQAIEQCTRIRNRPELALAHLELAELLLDAGAINRAPTLGDDAGAWEGPHPDPLPRGEGNGPSTTAQTRAEALQHLDFAIAELREMKMQPSLERALRHKEVLKA